jgi:4-nitrophenyl phosphatase
VRPYGLYILDMDGTLFRGDQALPGAVETVASLRARGAIVRFLTNNSGRTRDFYVEKLSAMGFPVEAGEIYSSAIGTAKWLRDQGIASAFVVGEDGLAKTLGAEGIHVVNHASGRLTDKEAPQAEAVVVGICRGLTYGWINSAMQQILSGARFVATNPDTTYPMEEGRLVPGAGAVVAAVGACSGAVPIVIGKPNPYLIELILREAGCSASETLVAGDRVDTDIEAGRTAGCDTLLVLTGVTTHPVEGYAFSDDLRGLF